MGEAPGFIAEVYRNGSQIGFSTISLVWDPVKSGMAWTVKLNSPITPLEDDTWTIILGLAGYRKTYVDAQPATNAIGDDNKDLATRTIKGEATDFTEIISYCVPKTLCFVNFAWLQDLVPGATIRDGVPMANGERIFYPRLPTKEFEEGQFECITGTDTHHAIAKYLANLVGFNLIINTPDIPLVDTCTVASGTVWFEAIKANPMLWFPKVEIRPPKSEGERPTIYIEDLIAGDGFPATPQILTINRAALVGTNYNQKLNQGTTVDHVIITGRTTKDTVIRTPEPPDMTLVEIPEITVEPNVQVVTPTSINNRLDAYRRGDLYTGTLGVPGNGGFTLSKLKNEYRVTQYFRTGTAGKIRHVTVQEDSYVYGMTGILSRHQKVFKYGANYKPIGTVESEYVYCRLPGESNSDLNLIKTKTTLQNHYIKSLNLTLTSELIQEVCMYTLDKNGNRTDSIPYTDMKRVDYSRDTMSPASQSSTTKERWHWLPTHERITDISRTDEDLLIKVDQDYATLPDITKTQSQILENPIRDKPDVSSTDNQFRREYYLTATGGITSDPAAGCGALIGGVKSYHPPKTLSHPDVATDEIAEALAARAFLRTGDPSYGVTVSVENLPIFLDTMIVMLNLPDMPWKEDEQTVIVPGGNYILKGMQFDVDAKGSPASNTVTLSCKQTFTATTRY
jgi:hypothetical protein